MICLYEVQLEDECREELERQAERDDYQSDLDYLEFIIGWALEQRK